MGDQPQGSAVGGWIFRATMFFVSISLIVIFGEIAVGMSTEFDLVKLGSNGMEAAAPFIGALAIIIALAMALGRKKIGKGIDVARKLRK